MARDGTPDVSWSDRDIIDYARSYAKEHRLPAVHVPLACALTSDAPDTALVRFDGRAPGPQITIVRYKR